MRKFMRFVKAVGAMLGLVGVAACSMPQVYDVDKYHSPGAPMVLEGNYATSVHAVTEYSETDSGEVSETYDQTFDFDLSVNQVGGYAVSYAGFLGVALPDVVVFDDYAERTYDFFGPVSVTTVGSATKEGGTLDLVTVWKDWNSTTHQHYEITVVVDPE